jgi:MFS family permease
MDGHTPESVGPAAEITEKSLWTRNFIAIMLTNLFIFIGFNMTTTGLPVYVSSLGAADSVTGLVTTLVTLSTLFIRPFSGMLLDRLGRKGLYLIGLSAMTVCIAGYAFFPIVGIILAIRFVHGLSWGVTSTAAATIAADIIPRKRFAEGMGYFSLSTAIAVAIAPALALSILENSGAQLMIMLAVITTFVGLVLACFQHTVKIERQPRSGGWQWRDLFEKSALLPSGITFLINCSFGSVTTFIALHAAANGVENIWLYFMVEAAVTLVTRPAVGVIIDKKGFFGPGLVAILSVIISLVLISQAHSVFLFCLAGLFGGLGFGIAMSTLQTMAVASAPLDRRGVATSTYFFGFDAGIGIGAAIGGMLAFAGYDRMYLIMIVFPALALLIFVTKVKRNRVVEAGK